MIPRIEDEQQDRTTRSGIEGDVHAVALDVACPDTLCGHDLRQLQDLVQIHHCDEVLSYRRHKNTRPGRMRKARGAILWSCSSRVQR
jgi:hypothetical protein